jgi:hypothetical protein
MIRNLLIMSALVAMNATAAAAQKNDSYFSPPNPRGVPLDLGPTRYIYGHPSESRIGQWQAEQLVRWGIVGQCVVAKDREASLSYVAARPGAPEATAAAKRLDPAFASCLVRSGIAVTNNKVLRRAAVADALGMRLSA